MTNDEFDEWLAAIGSTRAFGLRTGERTVTDDVDDLYTENYLVAVAELGASREDQARSVAVSRTQKQLAAMYGREDGACAWQRYRDECTQLGAPEHGMRYEKNVRRLGPAWAGIDKEIP